MLPDEKVSELCMTEPHDKCLPDAVESKLRQVYVQNKCSVPISDNALGWDTLLSTHRHSHLRHLDLQIHKLQQNLHRKINKISGNRGSI